MWRHPLPLLLLLAACPAGPPAEHHTHGVGLFKHGCPIAGESVARELKDVDETPWGVEALAGPGDVLLANEHAAFVIQNTEDIDTYTHYGGAPIDAVAVRDCDQAGPELFEEMGFLVGQLDMGDFNSSSLHQIRGESIDIVNDGSDGKAAVVEVHATDDRFWLVELTLIRNTWTGGGRKELGDLFGLDITLRYTLAPDSSALQMDVLLDGEPTTDGFLVGAIVFPSDEVGVHEFANGNLSVGGFGLDVGVPWLGMGGSEGAQAVAMPGANMSYTEVAGVRALLDVNQALAPLTVNGAAEPPETPFLLSVGATDAASASAALEPLFPEPVAGATWADLAGTVEDDDGPVAGAEVWVYGTNLEGDEDVVDRMITDDEGHFSGRTLSLGGGWTLVATADGRDDGTLPNVTAGADVLVPIGNAGSVTVDTTDDVGAPIPARVECEREDGATKVLYSLPGESWPLAPGHWHAWVSRGYEYTIEEADLTVEAGVPATLSVSLTHAVDTTGWASVDTHVHQEPSADSQTLNVDRFHTAAASGLDVMISTDHEAIIDLSPDLAASGAADWLTYGLGSEVTATVPEHTNPWPLPVDDSDPRGTPVRWYSLGFPGIYAAERERGARVIQLNHSRVNGECGILCVLDWDRGAEDPYTDDPEGIGLPAGTEVWSWDFNAFELLNSNRSPLLDPADPRHTGALVDWLAFLNLGHKVTGTAVTDVHGEQIPGEPRTFVRVPDDSPATATADDVADGELDGAAVISAGAFAEVSINGAGPGETVSVDPFGATLSIKVQAIPEVDVEWVYVLENCDLVATLGDTEPNEVIKLDTQVTLTQGLSDSYYVVLGFGDDPMPRGFDDYDPLTVPRFITNPIFVDGDGDGVWTPPGAKECATEGV